MKYVVISKLAPGEVVQQGKSDVDKAVKAARRAYETVWRKLPGRGGPCRPSRVFCSVCTFSTLPNPRARSRGNVLRLS